MTDVQCYGCEGDCWCHDCNGGGEVSEEQLAIHRALEGQPLDIVFDGPPSAVSGRFVEVEDAAGASVSCGEWIHREDGYWVLRIWARTNSPLIDALLSPPA
jgi:hypothetical protein